MLPRTFAPHAHCSSPRIRALTRRDRPALCRLGLLDVELAPPGRADLALDDFASGGRLELRTGGACLPLMRRRLIGDVLLGHFGRRIRRPRETGARRDKRSSARRDRKFPQRRPP